ncbi:MAG TPA: hypothetical protein DCE41_11645 [Cytophagales bacterium]|nr:hypothetical protein [Cytophagales bacterium]HAA17492.1 hypothetical protein [Cytophagales bacterium]HAP61071.1 hypothetical protein [Cytophagales bacterium]
MEAIFSIITLLGIVVPIFWGLVKFLRRFVKPNIQVIENPRIGVFPFVGDELAQELLEQDQRVYLEHFKDGEVVLVKTPAELRERITEGYYDLVHLLIRVNADSRIGVGEETEPVVNLIYDLMDTKTSHVIFAQENDPEATILTEGTEFSKNLVITINRNGEAFPTFFRQLYGLCIQGIPFGEAWVQLASQLPPTASMNRPDCLMLLNAPNKVLGPES